eukprot:m.285414 g.285414  ORF g.285414 m.285414 type:complete len:233 (-) comp11368_c0_seq1:265-963(-)
MGCRVRVEGAEDGHFAGLWCGLRGRRGHPQDGLRFLGEATIVCLALRTFPAAGRGSASAQLPHFKTMAARKQKKKRAQRATSNVFAMFTPEQIQEFKEAFNLIDQDHDGKISKEDLMGMYNSLGQEPSDEFLDDMLSEAPGQINFTMFLTFFGDKLTGTDPEEVIRNAFECFDTDNSGSIEEDKLRDLLMTMGDRFTEDEVEQMFRGAPIDARGNFNYVEFTRILKHGSKEE